MFFIAFIFFFIYVHTLIYFFVKDVVERRKKRMNVPVFCPDSFIVQDVFSALIQEPEKYNVYSLKGLNQLCDLGINLCVKNVKSFRGSYFQAKLIGVCLSTGYYNIHKNNMSDNNTVFDLIEMLGHMGTHFEKEIKYSAKQKPEDVMRIHLIRGFEDGIRLGRRIHKQ